jgi:hypothetical protein
MNQFSQNEVHATLSAMNKMSSARESAGYGSSFNQKMSNYLSLPNSSTLQQFDQLNQFPPEANPDLARSGLNGSFQNYLPLGPSPDVQLGLHSLSGNTASMDMNQFFPSLSMGTASNRMLQGNDRGQDNFLERQQRMSRGAGL